MSYYVGPPLILLLALVEVSVLPMFRISGLQPNLVLVLLVVWLMLRGPKEAFALVAVAGISIGLVDGAPLGTALLALAPLALLQEVRGAQLRESGLVMTTLFLLIMTFTYHLTYFLVFALMGEAGSLSAAITRVIIPTVVLNVLVLMPVYLLVSLSSQETRRASYV
ncbi:MAG: rod shape-determining protein MreD [Dehalococcoidia bacterium]|nr:rod shape-determining protein MreD [Dehalococcoidia bacterium]